MTFRKTLLFVSLFFILFSLHVHAVYTSVSGHDEEFSTADSINLLSYEWTTQSCFSKGWYSSYQTHGGIAWLNQNCSQYTTHTFYLKDDITTNWNVPYPVIAQVTYYINNTGNWNSDNRPSFYIFDTNSSIKLYETNLSTSAGWQTVSITGDLTVGHHYWLILDFKTWINMPSVFIAIDSMTFGTMIGSGVNPSAIVDMPLGCRLTSGQSYFYPFTNYANQSTVNIENLNHDLWQMIPGDGVSGWQQGFDTYQNSTLQGIMLYSECRNGGSCSPYGYWNWTLRLDNETGSIVASSTNWNLTTNGGWQQLSLGSNPTLYTSNYYYLQVFNTTSTNMGFRQSGYSDYYTDGGYKEWYSASWHGLEDPLYVDFSFVINLTTLAGESMPQAISGHTADWTKVSLVHTFDGSSWNIYNRSSSSGNLSYIYTGNIFYLDTINNSQITMTNCNGATCSSYTSNTIYSYPYAYDIIPHAIESHIRNWGDVDLIFGYDGTNWNYYDPDDPSSASLISLQRGQAFYIITKSGSSYTLGTTFYGTVCDAYDYTGRSYTITDGCDITYGQCPANTRCSQITPQVHVTTALVQDYVDCTMCWSLNSFIGNKLIWTNCPNNPECRCTDSTLCKSNVYETNITNVPYSVLEYTIGCYDLYGQKVLWIVNATGGNTTQEALINQSLNITTESSFVNETSVYTCDWTVNPMNAIAVFIGGAFGYTNCITQLNSARFITSIIFSFIISVITVITLTFIKIKGKIIGQIFIYGSLLWLVMFAYIGWFPAWLIIVLILFTAVYIVKAGLDIFAR